MIPVMNNEMDHETWLIEAGDAVVQKKLQTGVNGLTSVERLIYCVWVADYSVRNAGDLMAGRDLHEPFYEEAVQLAKALLLHSTESLFSLPPERFVQEYYSRFELICSELRSVHAIT